MADNYCYNCFTMRAGAGPCPHCGYDPELDRGRHAGALLHGSILAGRYIVGRVLGQGGFGITYVALDKPSGQKAAIKEYFPASLSSRMTGTSLVTAAGDSREFFRYGLERFLEEAKLLAQFNGNAHIVAVRSFFQENGTAYFVMDYIEGISFKMYLRNHGGRVSWQEAVKILRPVMKALAAVHRVGIIHRDVVPDNIYITGNGEVKLLDFGAARYSLGDRSRSLDVILRPGYAPREQYTSRSRQGPFTDVYSLAACFYAALTGYLPQESLERWEQDELVPISRYGVRVPAALEEVIYEGLAVQAEDRFQSMGDFLAALDQATAAANPPPQPPPPPPSKPPQPPPPQPQQPLKSPQSPQIPQPPPQSPPQPLQPPAQRTFPVGAAVCLAICTLGGLGGLGLLLAGSVLCLPAFAAALILGAAAFLLLRQGPQREQRYQDACAAYKTGDFSRALRLFRQAAEMGDARAKYCLGECFYWGNGVPADMRIAFKWYLEAAKSGNEDAYYKVACCYCSGDGVDADSNEAIRWLELAAASHSAAAGAARRMLDAMLPYLKR